MAFCAKCGAQLADNQPFCGACGYSVQQAQEPAPTANPAPQQTVYQAQLANPASPAGDAQANKTMGILAYLGVLVLIPIFAAKDSPFARYHANQGLVLAIAEIAYLIVYSILTAIFAAIMFSSTAGFALYGIITAVLGLLSLVFVVLAILGIINATKGECKPLPIIGGVKILK